MDLESVAAELSVLPPAEFVARRSALTKAAKADGQKELAEQVRRLVKPSASAWAVNLLATRRPSEFEKVVTLGSAFRDAAASGRPGALGALAAERRAVLRQATASALDLAEKSHAADVAGGAPALSAAAANDVEQTLQAVLADPAAAAAARTGRLVRALASTGVEAVDLADAVNGPFTPPEPAEEAFESGGEPAGPAGETARDARDALEAIEKQLGELSELRQRAREESDALADEIGELQARLTDLAGTLEHRRFEQAELASSLEETDREYGRLERQREKAARMAEAAARAVGEPAGRKAGAQS